MLEGQQAAGEDPLEGALGIGSIGADGVSGGAGSALSSWQCLSARTLAAKSC